MSRVSEQWSKANATSQGKPDANLANDSNNLGGIPAEDWATKQWVREYHDGKESDLGKYVDEQDQKMLDEAKEYANSLVRNQDFSGFAEIKDLQALNANLTEQITEGLTEQKNYTDSKTQQIVTDVNANFKDVENSISTLNGTVNNLFQSVSNGKGVIAEAITDKGVPTSATDSYSTMAGNIRSIKTAGDIEIDPNFVNTSDGTATENDIRLGKVAYVKGQKVYGSLVVEEGGSGTGGEGGSGEHNPNTGIDTSNATATAADILLGKTAYARGQYLVGTLVNTDVEEIYGINTNSLNIKELSLMKTDPITDETITRDTIGFSKDNNYCVSATRVNGVRYIESYAINDNGLYIQQTTGMSGEVATKKYRYTYSELGLNENERVVDIAFTCAGVRGVATDCYLILLTYEENSETGDNLRVRVYTYHLKDNGVIGKEYENQLYIVENLNDEYIDSRRNFKIVTPNLKSNVFFLVGINSINADSSTGYCKVYRYNLLELANGVTLSKSEFTSSSSNYSVPTTPVFSYDDRYILNQNEAAVVHYLCYIDQDYYPYFIYMDNSPSSLTKVQGTSYLIGVKYQNMLMVYEETLSQEQTVPTISNIKRLNINPEGKIPSIIYICNVLSMPDGDTLMAVVAGSPIAGNYKRAWIVTLSISEILSAATDTEVAIKSYVEIPSIRSGNSKVYPLLSNSDYTRIFMNYDTEKLYVIQQELDNENIVGVVYRGQYFYNATGKKLTATANDVASGKTFIGSTGYPQTGTMEV